MQKITIITVCYNHATGLERTMRSVLEQTYDSMEYIVIDGGSTDGSRELIASFQQHLAYWCSEKDNGIYDAMNKGLAKTTGEYCLFLNSGDYFCNDHVLQDVFGTASYDEDLLIGRQMFYDEKGKRSIAWSINPRNIDERFFWSNTLPHQATFIKTKLLKQLGGYDTDYKVCADWAFWYRAVVEHRCSYMVIDTPISMMEKGGVSNDMEKCRAEMADFLMKHHPVMTKADWMDINERYAEALSYRRASASMLSKWLLRLAIRLNKQ